MPKISSYQKDLIESLKDPCEAAAYLSAAIEEGDRSVFLLALRNVAEASGGMAALAEKANLSRESLYRMLSKKGNPEIKSLYTLLHAMGLRLAIEPEPHTCCATASPKKGSFHSGRSRDIPVKAWIGHHPTTRKWLKKYLVTDGLKNYRYGGSIHVGNSKNFTNQRTTSLHIPQNRYLSEGKA